VNLLTTVGLFLDDVMIVFESKSSGPFVDRLGHPLMILYIPLP
jgi:hypothetical protein